MYELNMHDVDQVAGAGWIPGGSSGDGGLPSSNIFVNPTTGEEYNAPPAGQFPGKAAFVHKPPMLANGYLISIFDLNGQYINDGSGWWLPGWDTNS